jgi:hypothetical protein
MSKHKKGQKTHRKENKRPMKRWQPTKRKIHRRHKKRTAEQPRRQTTASYESGVKDAGQPATGRDRQPRSESHHTQNKSERRGDAPTNVRGPNTDKAANREGRTNGIGENRMKDADSCRCHASARKQRELAKRGQQTERGQSQLASTHRTHAPRYAREIVPNGTRQFAATTRQLDVVETLKNACYIGVELLT